MPLNPVQFVIFSRSYCHLCDELRDALSQAMVPTDFRIEILDVDADPVLLARYDELVPVLGIRLTDRSVKYICHYVLDPVALSEALSDAKSENVESI